VGCCMGLPSGPGSGEISMGRIRVRLASIVRIFAADRTAITALEYGIIASALAFVIIAAFTSLGTPLSTIFTNVGNKL
jgi:pilus assembly protein Flp/PilA